MDRDGCLWVYRTDVPNPGLTDLGREKLTDFMREHKANGGDRQKTMTAKSPGS